MTLVECFDRSVTENVVSCLHLRPDKLIFLGEEHTMQAPLKRFRAFLSARGMDTRVETCHVNMNKMDSIAQVLADIVKREKQCVIDVTGGDERILMAVGAMLAGLDEQQRKRVAVQKFNLETGAAQDCDGDGQVFPGHPMQISVEELVALHGGAVHPASHQPEPIWVPRDLEPLWQIAARDPGRWNRMISTLEEFESWADSRNQVFLPLQYVRGSMAGFEEKRSLLLELLARFRENGIISDYSRPNALEYTYTTSLNRFCTLKAGNVLEVKTLLEARAMDLDGKPFFDDCKMGVHIDWDGILHEPADRIPETRNEIDLILMRGVTPLFVSCKNGDIDEEELYKLHTVATRFGGRTAKKMLIAADLEKKNPASTRAFIQRAVDMDIYLVTNAAGLTGSQWHEVFRDAIR